MKKRMTAFLWIVVLCLSFGIAAFAKEEPARLVDMANILSKSEESRVLAALDEISRRQQLDIVVVTADTLDGKTPMEYADDFYDENAYGFGEERDGVLLLVSMEDRDWWISTTGYGITVFTDAGIDYISEQFLSDLSDGNYAQAFICFADLCDKFITQAKTDRPYDIGNFPKKPFSLAMNVCIALVVGFIFAIVVVSVMAGNMKSVRFQRGASDYVKKGSMNITQSREMFLYMHMNRQEKPKSSSSGGGSTTHTSSSGTTHGGRGGKF